MYVRRIGPLVHVAAPAKVNLFLEVLGKREDGFHEIETLMAAISQFDSLLFEPRKAARLELTCRWASGWSSWARTVGGEGAALGDLPILAENLVLRAVDLLRQRAGYEGGAKLELTKRVASAAGLGGASSDAAAALLAANIGWGLRWPLERLAELAGQLGSDIPFFLQGGQQGAAAALCRGRGEQIRPLKFCQRLHLVVCRPPEGLSTAAVYRRCHAAERPVSVEPLIEALEQGQMPQIGHRLFNRLQPAAAELSPWIDRLQQRFARLDCWGHQMSGSGSSYFGLARHARHAQRVAQQLRTAKLGAVYCVSTVATTSQHLLRLSHLTASQP